MNRDDTTPVWRGPYKVALAGLLAIQFVAATIIGTGELLANDQHSIVPPVAITVAIPVALFLLAYVASERFRGFVLAQDLRLLTMMQLWRVIGFGFLSLYAFGALPGLFALPAGLGDVAIGVAALFVVARMDKDPDTVTSRGFVRFHLLGLFDFTVAVAAAGLSSGAFPALVADGVTSAPMDVWPLNIFPSFLVPAFIILHLVVLLKVRALRRTAAEPTKAVPHAA